MNRNRTIHGCLSILAALPVLALAQTPASVPGRLLASNCFQCHGTNGSGGFERLAGESSREIIEELREMRRDSTPDIMDIHARGYTDAQIKLIADYFAAQRSR